MACPQYFQPHAHNAVPVHLSPSLAWFWFSPWGPTSPLGPATPLSPLSPLAPAQRSPPTQRRNPEALWLKPETLLDSRP
eukprot:398519-Rhodomonas_salina.1